MSKVSVTQAATMSSIEPRSPGVRDMVPPLLIAPVVAGALFAAATFSWPAFTVAATAALVTVPLCWWPTIFWMLDNGRTGPVARTIVGALCGAAPLIAALGSGIIGHYVRNNDVEYVRWALGYGAPIPYFGVLIWPEFTLYLALAMISGIVTMWLSWMLSRSHKP